MLALQQPQSSSVIVIARCHAQIFVGVATYIGAYHLLSAYYLSTYCYKCMHLLIRFYSMHLNQNNYTLNSQVRLKTRAYGTWAGTLHDQNVKVTIQSSGGDGATYQISLNTTNFRVYQDASIIRQWVQNKSINITTLLCSYVHCASVRQHHNADCTVVPMSSAWFEKKKNLRY